MNRFSHNFAKHEGLPAKHLQPKRQKAKGINKADVAELVDARDLKSFAPTENAKYSCKILVSRPIETGGNPAVLQNIFPAHNSFFAGLFNALIASAVPS